MWQRLVPPPDAELILAQLNGQLASFQLSARTGDGTDHAALAAFHFRNQIWIGFALLLQPGRLSHDEATRSAGPGQGVSDGDDPRNELVPLAFGADHGPRWVALGPRPDDRPPHIAPIDVGLVDGGVEHVAGEIEIDRAGLAVQRLLEGEVDLLRQALQVVHAVGVFDPAFEGLDLVDLLKDLPAELADRGGAAQCDDRAAIDQRIGESGAEIERAGPARPDAHARPLGHPRIGLRHIGRGLLVPGVDEPDALLDAGRFDIEHRPAHDVEDVLDTLRLQAPGEDVVTRHFRHLRSS